MFQWLKKIFVDKFGFKSVVNTQIDLYLIFKKKYTGVTENEILDMLLESRIKSAFIIPKSTLQERREYYKTLLEDKNKTLEDVIFSIVWYEYIDSRKEWVDKNSNPSEQMFFRSEVLDYISLRIKDKIKT